MQQSSNNDGRTDSKTTLDTDHIGSNISRSTSKYAKIIYASKANLSMSTREPVLSTTRSSQTPSSKMLSSTMDTNSDVQQPTHTVNSLRSASSKNGKSVTSLTDLANNNSKTNFRSSQSLHTDRKSTINFSPRENIFDQSSFSKSIDNRSSSIIETIYHT